MGAELKVLCDESVAFEKNMAALYKLYAALYRDDAGFWQELQIEEEQHVSIVTNLYETYAPLGLFPTNLLDTDLGRLRAANRQVEFALARFNGRPPSKHEAYAFAVRMEESSGEMYYREAMIKDSNDEILDLVQQVNNNDKNHAVRIRDFMAEKGIS
ncbi:MAG: hypothetical protein JXR37_32830 [Kiritimatiellae bacterium]|nr:hypothetical protein [Kiritimatiellia bacterium]